MKAEGSPSHNICFQCKLVLSISKHTTLRSYFKRIQKDRLLSFLGVSFCAFFCDLKLLVLIIIAI